MHVVGATMRVLITGGYGFIGSYVAERFYQEGYEVSIIDNLSSGDKRNIDFKHKAYVIAVEDRNCEEIFRSNRFDVVIHLAAQVNVDLSMENPSLDTKSNVLGLSNMLSLSHKYGVKKFLFASSAAVYGINDQIPLKESAPCNPISTYGINKWIGEMYCRKWQEMYGLQTLCFRFSNVYGPRQGNSGEGGVISILIKRLMEGKELFVFGDGEQTRDFIYVEDVADAIYRASYSDLTGVYNLSNNTENSVNHLIAHLKRLHGSMEVSYKEKRDWEIYRSKLDNTQIIEVLDWVPIYSFEEGLHKTYEWFRHEKLSSERKRSSEDAGYSVIVPFVRTAIPYLENIIAFAVTAYLTLALENKLYSIIDFNLFYIIILGIIYGNRQSIIAVSLATSLFIYQQLAGGRELISLLNDTDFFFRIAIYLCIGLVVGYSIERKTLIIQAKEEQLHSLEDKYAFLSEVFNETRQIKEELQQQIMNNGDSFGKIYSIIKELESLEPEKIFTSTVNVVESIMKAQTVTIYKVNSYKSYLRLLARSSSNNDSIPKSIKVAETEYLWQVLYEKKLYVNKELLGDMPLLAAPVLSNGEVIAVISVYDMRFENFTLYHQNLFKIIVDLISSALSRALTYVEATGDQRYIQGTSILKQEVFDDILTSKKMAKERYGVEFVLLAVDSAISISGHLSQQISGLLRETDYIGLGKNGQLLVLLTNSNLSEAEFVLDRFRKYGISLHNAEEEFGYA